MDSLFLRENCDIYPTGSNGYQEFCAGLEGDPTPLAGKFERYIRSGSFPYVLRYGYGEQEAREYMNGIYHTILLNDIVKRLRVGDVNMLEAITRFLMHNIGNRTSPAVISGTMTSQRMKIDPKTVDHYIRGLTDSLLFYEARRYNIKGKKLLSSATKYHICDVAMRSLQVRNQESDIGQLGADGEVDFVAFQNGMPAYYQVAQTTLDEQVLKRELAPLRQISDNYPKYLLTLDEVFGELDYDGIQKRNALKWLLESP